uniref:HD domain-containing protein n=1 Tax=Schlesneria paludicola TaxID=360056 RepID=A0A7C4LIZ2_9PLAN
MPRSTPETRVFKLSELQPGQHADCFAVLVKKDRGQTRDGKPYFRVTFRDVHRTATSMIWADSGWYDDCEQQWQPGQCYKLRVRYLENQYGPQLELEKIRPVDDSDRAAGFQPADYYPSSRFDSAQMFAQLVALAEREIADKPLRQLTVALLRDHAEPLLSLAAAVYHHHAFRGGFLEHVLSVAHTAVFLADKYLAVYPELRPPLSKSLVVAGAILHDIGKLLELEQRPQGADYTPHGRLIGHIVLGRDLIRAKAASIPDLDAEQLLRLEHIILSHQGTPEWGSPIPPATPEALLVHYADDLDAKFQMMAAALSADPAPGQEQFTSKDNPLGRRLFRGLGERR